LPNSQGCKGLKDCAGGIRQESQAASPMMQDLLLRLKKEDGLQGSLRTETWVHRPITQKQEDQEDCNC